MPDQTGPEHMRQQDSALAVLAEIANDNLAERLRHEAAARIITAARRIRMLVCDDRAPRHHAGEHFVDTLAASWDPRALTALEFAEMLPIRVLDGLLGAAPRWARAMRAAMDAQLPGAAAA
jgi:hypothetical protein